MQFFFSFNLSVRHEWVLPICVSPQLTAEPTEDPQFGMMIWMDGRKFATKFHPPRGITASYDHMSREFHCQNEGYHPKRGGILFVAVHLVFAWHSILALHLFLHCILLLHCILFYIAFAVFACHVVTETLHLRWRSVTLTTTPAIAQGL